MREGGAVDVENGFRRVSNNLIMVKTKIQFYGFDYSTLLNTNTNGYNTRMWVLDKYAQAHNLLFVIDNIQLVLSTYISLIYYVYLLC